MELFIIPLFIGLVILSKKWLDSGRKYQDEHPDEFYVTNSEYERVLQFMFSNNIIDTKEYLHLQTKGASYTRRG